MVTLTSQKGIISLEEWENERRKIQNSKIEMLPKHLQAFISGVNYNELSEHLKQNKKPSDFIKKDMASIVKTLIRKDLVEYLYTAVDSVINWQYSESVWRRSYRSSSYAPYYNVIETIISSFIKISLCDSSIEDILTDNMPEPEKQYVHSYYSGSAYEFLIACELDKSNPRILSFIEECIMEAGTNLRYEYIRGIVRSHNTKAHELLGKLLTAARLQEGVRQSICESADLGTIEAFQYLINVIKENDLIRFSAVKRAMWTWCGISAESTDLERISGKTFNLIIECLESTERINECLKSEDAIEIYIALWTVSFRDAVKGIQVCNDLILNGTKHHRLAAGIFALSFNDKDFSNNCGKIAIRCFANEHDTMAVFLNCFMYGCSNSINTVARESLPNFGYGNQNKKPGNKRVIPDLNEYFTNTIEAAIFYEILKKMLDSMPKKELKFEPCVFPWAYAKLSRSDIIIRMAWIACALADNEKIDEVCCKINEVSDLRDNVLIMLTMHPRTQIQKQTAVAAIANRESYTRSAANMIVKYISLDELCYAQLEEMLKYKTADIRANVIKLLLTMNDEKLFETCNRLLSDKKSEKRLAGLDIALQLKTNEDRTELYAKIKDIVSSMDRSISKENILIEQIAKSGNKDTEFLPLYENFEQPLPEIDKNFIKECNEAFSVVFPECCFVKNGNTSKPKHKMNKEKPDYLSVIEKLDALILEHEEDEVTDYDGSKVLLINSHLGWYSKRKSIPLIDIWEDFYKNEIGSIELLYRMRISRLAGEDVRLKNQPWYIASRKMVKDILGEELAAPDYGSHNGLIFNILDNLYDIHITKNNPEFPIRVAASLTYKLLSYDNSELLFSEKKRGNAIETDTYSVVRNPVFAFILNDFSWNFNDDLFRKIFPIRMAFSRKTDYIDFCPFHPPTIQHIDVNEMLRAHGLGIVTENEMYRFFFEVDDMNSVLSSLSQNIKFILERDKQVAGRNGYVNKYWEKNVGIDLTGKEDVSLYSETDHKVLDISKDAYEKITSRILEFELNRGDSETPYSKNIDSLKRIYGAERFVKILSAMGKDTFVRGYIYGSTKRECLSHLISVCVPNDGENAGTLRKLLKNTDITETKLIEAAMYSPEWLDIMEDYLNWEGFRSGCYYFMAHMNETFDEKRTAIIAKYTPLEIHDLQAGAFDVNWFHEAYDQLGEKRFQILYDAAKYISDGAKHSRARKYADAVMGKLNYSDTEQEITLKRNKDLLMAYSLIPFKDDKELLKRYMFLQKFLKESKKFGAQRRASESLAVQICLQNLSITAGYSDVTRLKLKMEAKLFEEIYEQFEAKEIDDVKVWIRLSGEKVELCCEKNGKLLKNIPSRLKKNEYICMLNETRKNLNEQFSRTKQMFEHSMEDKTLFTIEEIRNLQVNPIAFAVTDNLVFVTDDGRCLMLKNGNLTGADGTEFYTEGSMPVRVAHPFDMYREGSWRSYQKYLIENKIVQPFRQVFRELYLKTDEEQNVSQTMRFAGNQIQPKKTAACLKSRRWVCDVENGLQKVYFKENIIAELYAVADWFSPSDIEAPTLEYVNFSDRKTGNPVIIKDLPDILFSEVMRDTDLAVSICHAGDVDPEHSHSTIEMRSAILEFTLPLFKIKNCEIKGSHVFINGTRGNYNIHLGSGVVHIHGGAALNILPVHSQHRGRLFLPFADDDPKTAEIISKVLLLAEDSKIKDPFILEQINHL